MANERDAARVRVPPPLLALLGIAGGVALNQLWPLEPLPFSYARVVVGAAVALVGLTLIVVTAVSLKRSGQNPEPWQPTPSVLIGGTFRFSRNPVYLGMLVVQLGASVVIGTAWIAVMVFPTWLALRQLVVLREEAYLEKKFGETYLAYKRSVRRWL